MIDAKIVPLNEGYYTIGFDKIFFPFDKEKDVLEERSRGSLLVEIQPFLIITEERKILIDSGLGFSNPETKQLKILENLAVHNLAAHDITDVIMSHLHKDHSGGLVTDLHDERELTFQNATYHINQKEFDFAINPKNKMSYDTDKLEFLFKEAEIKWFEGGSVFDFITYVEDGGHCPHHCSILMHTNSGKYFFGGDVAPQLKQLKFRYIAKYDFDGKKSLELRAQYAEKGKAEDWTFLFYHDVEIPMAKL
jgi:glyoxylase-like metal-dependent hydrolase (beta-lactamase superfamily II)